MAYQQYKKIDTTGHTFKDSRLSEIEWKEITNHWGRTSWVIKAAVAKEKHPWFMQYFVDIADSEYRIFEEEGVYYYKWKGEDVYKNIRQVKKDPSLWDKTPEEKEAIKKQRQEDLAGLEGTSTSKQEYWDKRQAQQEERDKAFAERHDESMLVFRAVIDATNINTESNNRIAKALEDANRLKQIELGQGA